jgi:Protein of unknown function (DUF2695)
MTKSEKERRNAIKRQIKEREKVVNQKFLPISMNKLKELFDYLADQLFSNVCNDTLRFTNNFIRENNLPEADLVKWLGENGGYCDCEVLANVENEINDK